MQPMEELQRADKENKLASRVKPGDKHELFAASVCVCVCVCVWVCPCVCVWVCACISLSGCVCVCVCFSPIFLSLSLSLAIFDLFPPGKKKMMKAVILWLFCPCPARSAALEMKSLLPLLQLHSMYLD